MIFIMVLKTLVVFFVCLFFYCADICIDGIKAKVNDTLASEAVLGVLVFITVIISLKKQDGGFT